jgi:acyl dehydratase
MAVTAKELKIGLELQPLAKKVSQRNIDLFETWGPDEGSHRSNYHTDVDAAKEALGGFKAPIASGRMLVDYGLQALAGWFGRDAVGRTGRVELRFLVPVVDGDTLSIKGMVTRFRTGADGTDVNLELWVENQKAQKAAVGTGSLRFQ